MCIFVLGIYICVEKGRRGVEYGIDIRLFESNELATECGKRYVVIFKFDLVILTWVFQLKKISLNTLFLGNDYSTKFTFCVITCSTF